MRVRGAAVVLALLACLLAGGIGLAGPVRVSPGPPADAVRAASVDVVAVVATVTPVFAKHADRATRVGIAALLALAAAAAMLDGPRVRGRRSTELARTPRALVRVVADGTRAPPRANVTS